MLRCFFIRVFLLCLPCLPVLAWRDNGKSILNAGFRSTNAKVLWFVPVGNATMALTARNVAHLRQGAVDIFLAHYDGTAKLWREQPWYNSSVKFSVEYKAAKVEFVHRELVDGENYNFDGYRWIWISDDNIDITGLNVKDYVRLADNSGAVIVQPAVDDTDNGVSSHEMLNVFRIRLPGIGRCAYRLTDFVEVMSPMFRPSALKIAYRTHLKGTASDWGMDNVWCHYVASQMALPQDKACAVVDATPMVKIIHGQSYEFYEGLLAFRHVRRNFTAYEARSMDTFMRRKPGHIEWCMPFNRSIGLVKLNFTTGGLMAGPAFISMELVSEYRFQRGLGVKEFLIGWTATRSFLRYHLSGVLIILTLLVFFYWASSWCLGSFPGLRPIQSAPLPGQTLEAPDPAIGPSDQYRRASRWQSQMRRAKQ